MSNEYKGALSFGGWVNDHAHLDKGLLVTRQEYTDVSAPQRGLLTRNLKKAFTTADICDRASLQLEQMIEAGTVLSKLKKDSAQASS